MNTNDYLLLFSPIVLGLGSAAFIDKKKIPKVNSAYDPPAWVFGLVWPILYLLLGYSAYLIGQGQNTLGQGQSRNALTFFFVHLFFLLIWWPIFVYYPNPFYSSITLFILACSAVFLCYLYSKINMVAAYCLAPYVLWLFFATFLSSQTKLKN